MMPGMRKIFVGAFRTRAMIFRPKADAEGRCQGAEEHAIPLGKHQQIEQPGQPAPYRGQNQMPGATWKNRAKAKVPSTPDDLQDSLVHRICPPITSDTA